MFKKVPVETREEILAKIKNGETVANTANQYGISSKTIYAWLRNSVKSDISIIECTCTRVACARFTPVEMLYPLSF